MACMVPSSSVILCCLKKLTRFQGQKEAAWSYFHLSKLSQILLSIIFEPLLQNSLAHASLHELKEKELCVGGGAKL